MPTSSPLASSPIHHIAAFLGAGSALLILPALYGMYFIYSSGELSIILMVTVVFLVGCILCAGYIQMARHKPYWLKSRHIWVGSILFNGLLLLGTFGFVLSGLWCFTVWQVGAIVLSGVALYREDKEREVR